jgi:hypothetical protein
MEDSKKRVSKIMKDFKGSNTGVKFQKLKIFNNLLKINDDLDKVAESTGYLLPYFPKEWLKEKILGK